MSKETNIYNTFVTQVSVALSDKKQLRNKYVISDNADQFLKDGYSVLMGPATNTDTLNNYFQQLERVYTIQITKKVLGRDLDISKVEDAEKLILSEKETLISHLLNYTTSGSTYDQITYSSDGGVESVFGDDNKNYLFMSIDFTVIYSNKF